MDPFGGNSEPVRFAYAEATQLASALRAAATELDSQATTRSGWAAEALREWRGKFAEEFRSGSGVGTDNARDFASALRDAARALDNLAQEALEEQGRRDKAAAWQAEQDSESWLEKSVEGIFNTDEKPPDTGMPREGRAVSPQSPAARRRI